MATRKSGKKKNSARKTRTESESARKSAKRKSTRKRNARRTARAGKPRKKQAKLTRQVFGSALPRSQKGQPLNADTDSQGLSDVEQADSESVDELLGEGNAFEAGVVRGVEQAEDADEREVHTREVPEDDVPTEYLDEN